MADFRQLGYVVFETPMEQECKKIIQDPRRGKNMWCLGLLCAIYRRNLDIVYEELQKKVVDRGGKNDGSVAVWIRGEEGEQDTYATPGRKEFEMSDEELKARVENCFHAGAKATGADLELAWKIFSTL